MSSAEVHVMPMSAVDARKAVDAIKGHLNSARQLIHDLHRREGWRALGYASWRECVTAEFEQCERQLYRELNAAQIEAVLTNWSKPDITIPESQLRPLVPLRDKPEVVREAWTRAVEQSNGHPTAKHVQAAVDEVIAARPAPPSLFRDREEESAPAAQDAAAIAAERWNASIRKLRDDIKSLNSNIFLLTNSMERRGGIEKLTEPWPREAVGAAIEYLADLRNFAGTCIEKLKGVSE